MRTTAPGTTATSRPRPRRAFPVPLLALLALSAGCKSNPKYDLIEAELRTRDRELREARLALEQSRVINRAFEQQLQAAPVGAGGPPRTTLAPGIHVKEIALGRGTGGYDEDDCPGDEALMVVVVPRDEDGSAVKVPARLTVVAWQVDPQGLKSTIGTWELPAERLRAAWKAGLFNTGYSVVLPWQTFPATDRVRVAARLTTLDGRSFEADRDVTVRPLPAPRRPGAAGPALPPPIHELPMPGGAPPTVPGFPVVPPNPREFIPPAPPPPGVPPTIPTGRPSAPVPPGAEELPPPADFR